MHKNFLQKLELFLSAENGCPKWESVAGIDHLIAVQDKPDSRLKQGDFCNLCAGDIIKINTTQQLQALQGERMTKKFLKRVFLLRKDVSGQNKCSLSSLSTAFMTTKGISHIWNAPFLPELGSTWYNSLPREDLPVPDSAWHSLPFAIVYHGKQCASFSSSQGKLQVDYCQYEYFGVCERSSNTGGCSGDWLGTTPPCYQIRRIKDHFVGHREGCLGIGGHLATIDDTTATDKIKQVLGKIFRFGKAQKAHREVLSTIVSPVDFKSTTECWSCSSRWNFRRCSCDWSSLDRGSCAASQCENLLQRWQFSGRFSHVPAWSTRFLHCWAW